MMDGTSNPQLEDRVIARLKADGMLRRDRAGHRWPILAAGMMAGVAGVLGLQSLPFRTQEPNDRSFLLALYEDRAFVAGSQGERAAEYAAWWESHSKGRARITDGVELLPSGSVALGRRPAQSAALAGYFIVRALDRDEALKLARTTPHLRHGGTAVLTPMQE